MSYVRGQDDGFTDGADPNGRDELAGGGHDQGVEVARTALGRRQIVDEVATLHQARSDVLCCGIDIGSRRRTRCIPRLFGCLEPKKGARQSLGNGVVDFAREALSLSGNVSSAFGICQCRLRFCYLTQKPKAFSGISFHLPVRGRDQCRGAQRPEVSPIRHDR